MKDNNENSKIVKGIKMIVVKKYVIYKEYKNVFFNNKCVFVFFMCDVFFDCNCFDIFGCFIVFIIVFYLWIYFVF